MGSSGAPFEESRDGNTVGMLGKLKKLLMEGHFVSGFIEETQERLHGKARPDIEIHLNAVLIPLLVDDLLLLLDERVDEFPGGVNSSQDLFRLFQLLNNKLGTAGPVARLCECVMTDMRDKLGKSVIPSKLASRPIELGAFLDEYGERGAELLDLERILRAKRMALFDTLELAPNPDEIPLSEGLTRQLGILHTQFKCSHLGRILRLDGAWVDLDDSLKEAARNILRNAEEFGVNRFDTCLTSRLAQMLITFGVCTDQELSIVLAGFLRDAQFRYLVNQDLFGDALMGEFYTDALKHHELFIKDLRSQGFLERALRFLSRVEAEGGWDLESTSGKIVFLLRAAGELQHPSDGVVLFGWKDQEIELFGSLLNACPQFLSKGARIAREVAEDEDPEGFGMDGEDEAAA